MNEIKDTLEFDDLREPTLPSGLNILTILTFIGSAIAAISLTMNYFQDCDKVLEQLEDLPEMSGFLDRLMNMSKLSLAVMCENKLLITISSAVGIFLCIAGAVQMRQLKKQGLMLYLVGEFLAPVVVLILSISSAPIMALTSFIVPVIMTIFYLTQSKYLVK